MYMREDGLINYLKKKKCLFDIRSLSTGSTGCAPTNHRLGMSIVTMASTGQPQICILWQGSSHWIINIEERKSLCWSETCW